MRDKFYFQDEWLIRGSNRANVVLNDLLQDMKRALKEYKTHIEMTQFSFLANKNLKALTRKKSK